MEVSLRLRSNPGVMDCFVSAKTYRITGYADVTSASSLFLLYFKEFIVLRER